MIDRGFSGNLINVIEYLHWNMLAMIRPSKKSKSIALRVFFVLSLGTVSICCTWMPDSPEISHEQLLTLRTVCNEMPVPGSFKKRRERSTEKPRRVVYSAEYYSKEDQESVKRFYESDPFFRDWEYQLRSSAGTLYLDFVKERYKITLEFQTFSLTDEKVYLLSCSWGHR